MSISISIRYTTIFLKVSATGGASRFAYCSSLAIYTYKLDLFNEFVIDKIIAGHKDRITSITWNPSNPKFLASCSVEKRISIWDVAAEKHYKTFPINETPLCLDWSPHSDSEIVYGTDHGLVQILDHNKKEGLLVKEGEGIAIKVVRFSPKVRGMIAVGDADGNAFVYRLDPLHRKRLRVSPAPSTAARNECAVLDVQWDPMSTNYLLVAHAYGSIALFDCDSEDEIRRVEAGAGLAALSWLPSAPGGFVSTLR